MSEYFGLSPVGCIIVCTEHETMIKGQWDIHDNNPFTEMMIPDGLHDRTVCIFRNFSQKDVDVRYGDHLSTVRSLKGLVICPKGECLCFLPTHNIGVK